MKSWFAIIFKIFTPVRLAIIFGLGLFLFFLIFGDQGLIELNKIIFMKKKLSAQQEMLKTSREELKREKELLHDPKYLEGVIRRELGFIKPGEVIYQEKERSAP